MRYFGLLLIILAACGEPPQNEEVELKHEKLAPGPWRFTLDLNGTELPFQAEVRLTGYGEFDVEIRNAQERLVAEDGKIVGDSIFFTMPLFDSEFRGHVESPHLITGYWYNYTRDDYRIPFVAEHGKEYRFSPRGDDVDIPNRYKITVLPPNADPYTAVLLVNKDSSNTYTGTVMRETGDYRFLEGAVIQNKLYLSMFNGNQAYYFSAEIADDALVNGEYLSGNHYRATWEGVVDSTYFPPDPTKMARLKDGVERIDFSLPNQNGEVMTWEDMNYDGKVVVIEITGSWCPNCLDAKRAIHRLFEEFDADEVAFLPINFEISDSLSRVLPSILRMQRATGGEMPFLFGGKATRENVETALPMLEGFRAYPTLIFVDKQGKVARIYTGFYGPGTGAHYDNFMRDTHELLKRLVDA